MGERGDDSSSRTNDLTVRPFKVFVNYRRDDTAGHAGRLYDRLAEHFGTANVFFDAALEPGADWRTEITASVRDGSAFLALIGARWASSLHDRNVKAITGSAEDYVYREIEWALRDWSGPVIPVLIDTAMPDPEELPRSIEALVYKQASFIRHISFDSDVAQLVRRLDHIAEEGSDPFDADQSRVPSPRDRQAALLQRLHEEEASEVPSPNLKHYLTVISGMIEGSVVPVVGQSLHGNLPDTRHLAVHLAKRFNIDTGSIDLAEIAQYIMVTSGEEQLYGAVRPLLATPSVPARIYRLLAELPGLFRKLQLPPRYQLIVTTGYDWNLEEAFRAAREPFDYAVYTARDGSCVHFPWRDEAIRITEPQAYGGFPILEDGGLSRTVIMKVYGAAESGQGAVRLQNDYFLTEDQYIDYLPGGIHAHIPAQILAKLKKSHCLFLGYRLSDWSARVFLKRLWQWDRITENSWAIEDGPDDYEKESWKRVGRVDLLSAPLADYGEALQAELLRSFGTDKGIGRDGVASR